MANADSTPAVSKARSRRKSPRTNPKVVANIIHLSYERRKEAAREKWDAALITYVCSLNKHEFDIAKHVMMFVSQKPCLVDLKYSCEVISFKSKNNLK